MTSKNGYDITKGGFDGKAYDQANGGWGKSKLVDGPTLGWFLDRAKAGDAEATPRIKRTLTISNIKPTLAFESFSRSSAARSITPGLACGKSPVRSRTSSHIAAR